MNLRERLPASRNRPLGVGHISSDSKNDFWTRIFSTSERDWENLLSSVLNCRFRDLGISTNEHAILKSESGSNSHSFTCLNPLDVLISCKARFPPRKDYHMLERIRNNT